MSRCTCTPVPGVRYAMSIRHWECPAHGIDVREETGMSRSLWSLFVNGYHVWRFDSKSDAEDAARNLREALSGGSQ